MATPTMVDEEIDVNGENVVTKFWSCPVNFIPESVWVFLKYRSFHERHPSAPFPELDETSPRYLKAESVFDAEYMKYISEGD